MLNVFNLDQRFFYIVMSDSTNRSIQMGVSLVVAMVLAVVGVGILDGHNLTQEFEIDTESEWNDYSSTLTNVEVTAEGEVQLSSASNTGTYDSVVLDSNESDSTRYNVYASVPEPENSSVSLLVNGNTYDVEDGLNKFDLESGASEFDLEFNRDADTVESPSVTTLVGLSGDTGGLLRLVGTAAFGLLVLMTVVQYARMRRR